MSCWVFCDGDFCVTIPDGTTMIAGGFYLVGSASGAGCGVGCDFSFTPNLDWGSCGCTDGSTIGVFTNSREQVVLFDDTGTIINAVYWSGGQSLPDTGNSSAAVGTCSSQTLTLPAITDPAYENIGSSGGNGESKARTSDGGGSWATEDSPSPGSSNAALPIALGSFMATASQELVHLKWNTLSEVNNDYFTVERSINGKTFTPLLKVSGAGNSNEVISYEITDENPLLGKSYYRLRQTDFDGKSESFNIEHVDRSTGLNIKIYPRPTTQNDKLTLEFSGNENESLSIEIYDLKGKLMSTKSIIDLEKYNRVELTPNLEPGIYLIKVASLSFSLSERLIIIE